MTVAVNIPAGKGSTIDIPSRSSIAIGSPIYGTTSAFQGSILFQGSGNVVAHDANFTYDTATSTLSSPYIFATTTITDYIYFGTDLVVDLQNYVIYDGFGNESMNFDQRSLRDSGGALSLDWNSRFLYDSSETLSIAYGDRILWDSSGLQAFDWNSTTLGFPNATTTTGSGVGTLTNVPTAGGNPVGYLQVSINGNTRYIPFW